MIVYPFIYLLGSLDGRLDTWKNWIYHMIEHKAYALVYNRLPRDLSRYIFYLFSNGVLSHHATYIEADRVTRAAPSYLKVQSNRKNMN